MEKKSFPYARIPVFIVICFIMLVNENSRYIFEGIPVYARIVVLSVFSAFYLILMKTFSKSIFYSIIAMVLLYVNPIIFGILIIGFVIFRIIVGE